MAEDAGTDPRADAAMSAGVNPNDEFRTPLQAIGWLGGIVGAYGSLALGFLTVGPGPRSALNWVGTIGITLSGCLFMTGYVWSRVRQETTTRARWQRFRAMGYAGSEGAFRDETERAALELGLCPTLIFRLVQLVFVLDAAAFIVAVQRQVGR